MFHLHSKRKALSLISVCLLFAVTIRASNVEWTGPPQAQEGGEYEWLRATNWNPATIPSPTDDVFLTLKSNYSVVLNSTELRVQNLTLDTRNGQLKASNISADININSTFHFVSGSIRDINVFTKRMDTSSCITSYGPCLLLSSRISIGSCFSNNGFITMKPSTDNSSATTSLLTVHGRITNRGQLVITGAISALSLSNYNTLEWHKTDPDALSSLQTFLHFGTTILSGMGPSVSGSLSIKGGRFVLKDYEWTTSSSNPNVFTPLAGEIDVSSNASIEFGQIQSGVSPLSSSTSFTLHQGSTMRLSSSSISFIDQKSAIISASDVELFGTVDISGLQLYNTTTHLPFTIFLATFTNSMTPGKNNINLLGADIVFNNTVVGKYEAAIDKTSLTLNPVLDVNLMQHNTSGDYLDFKMTVFLFFENAQTGEFFPAPYQQVKFQVTTPGILSNAIYLNTSSTISDTSGLAGASLSVPHPVLVNSDTVTVVASLVNCSPYAELCSVEFIVDLKKPGLSAFAVMGMIIGTVGGAIIIGLVLWFVVGRYRRRRYHDLGF